MDQVANVLAVDVLEEHVGRPVAWEHVRVDDAHNVGVLGQVDEGLVLLLEPLQRRVAVAEDELQRPGHVAEGVDHLVDDAEGAAAELGLNLELAREQRAPRDVRPVDRRWRRDGASAR